MTDFQSLIRLHRWQLDERRRALVELEALGDRLREEMRRLDEELEAEKEAARSDLEAARTYTGYLKTVAVRRERLDQSIRQVEQQIATANDEVMATFQDLKKFEIAQAEREKRQRLHRQRRENAQTDEIAQARHRAKEPSG